MQIKKGKRDVKQIVGSILFISLLLSAVYTVIRLIFAPSANEPSVSGTHRSDYTLMLLQCVVAIAVMTLPAMIERKWKVPIPSFAYILYYIFLYCGVFLGEVFSFYYRIKHWDTILHCFSGAMLASLGFILISILNEYSHFGVVLSPFFIAMFAFCFSMALGSVWELYEFAMDSTMGLNMQKYMTEAGVALVGRDALMDTMQDLICDAGATLVVSVLGYINLKKKDKRVKAP